MYLRYNISRWKRGATIEGYKDKSYIVPVFNWEMADYFSYGGRYKVSIFFGITAYIPVGMV